LTDTLSEKGAAKRTVALASSMAALSVRKGGFSRT
jgi:hypothetical protein